LVIFVGAIPEIVAAAIPRPPTLFLIIVVIIAAGTAAATITEIIRVVVAIRESKLLVQLVTPRHAPLLSPTAISEYFLPTSSTQRRAVARTSCADPARVQHRPAFGDRTH